MSCWPKRLLLTSLSVVPVIALPQNPCVSHPTQLGWRVFADRKDGFCFEYPSDYKRVAAVLASGPCGVKEGCLLSLKKNVPPSSPASNQDEVNNASIDLSSLRMPLQLDLLTRNAPTGDEDNSPKIVRFGGTSFYYYGPGGGGVTYPDQFFFKAKGQAFSIAFTGPYTNDKTPAEETKQIERRLLASFRHFR